MNVADRDGRPFSSSEYTYQWFTDTDTTAGGETMIAGATGRYYTVLQEQVGSYLGVEVRYTDNRDNAETLTAYTMGVVEKAPNKPGMATLGSHTAQVGHILRANFSDPDGKPTSGITYRWFTDSDRTVGGETTIAGAAGGTYAIQHSQVGSHIGVTITYTDLRGNADSATAYTDSAVRAAPNRPGAAYLHGTSRVDETLTAGFSDQDGKPTSGITYRWFTDSDRTVGGETTIPGATGSTYTVLHTQVGSYIGVEIRYIDGRDNVETLTAYTRSTISAAADSQGMAAQAGFARTDQMLTAYFTHPDGNSVDVAQEHASKWIGVDTSNTDDLGNKESFTQFAMAAVIPAQSNPGIAPSGDSELHAAVSPDFTWADGWDLANEGGLAFDIA